MSADLRRALERRRALAGRPDLTAYRLLNGAADGLAGLAVDRFGDVLVLHATSPVVVGDGVPARLADLVGARAAYLKLRPAQASRLGEDERRSLAPSHPIWGEPVERVVAVENGARYAIRPGAGLGVGLFLDMREVRAWVRAQAGGRSVLNLFAYTCAFGVCAALGGAERVLNVDVSKASLRWGQENYALNGLDAPPRDFLFGDALEWLARLARRRERFDLVLVDPPSFSTTRRGPFAVERDYGRLAGAAARVVAPGGILLAATNHAGLAVARVDALLAQGLDEAGRRGRRVRRWHEPSMDFPVAAGARPYLKVQALELA